MDNLHLAVIPAEAGIPEHLESLDSCLRRHDGQEAFFDTFLSTLLLRERERAGAWGRLTPDP